MSILERIFEHKREEIAAQKKLVDFAEMRDKATSASKVRPFRQALVDSGHDIALIAEVKKASPSEGLIRTDFDPVAVAQAYHGAGADCLSVLTDEHYFQGAPEYLHMAREASGLPCLRKDFICDPYQVYQARAWEADCILLIVAALDKGEIEDLSGLACELEMDVLVEVHSPDEARAALDVKADFIGVNNRNLADMSTSIDISLSLLPELSKHAFTVSESALSSRDDLDRVMVAGAGAVLIGTAFCAAPDIEAKVREVMAWPR